MISKLSHRVRKIGGVFPDPWQRLADDWPDVEVERADLGPRWEVTRWEAGRTVIQLHVDLTQVQERVALTHALEHLDRGAPCRTLRRSIEQRVVDATARWLLPDVEQLAAAITAYDCELHRVAHELCVPFHVLIDRIKTLTENEWQHIEQARERAA